MPAAAPALASEPASELSWCGYGATRSSRTLVQDQALPGRVGALVPSGVRLRDRLPLRHRQSHHPGLTARPEPAPQERPTRAFLRESTKPLHARISDESTRPSSVGACCPYSGRVLARAAERVHLDQLVEDIRAGRGRALVIRGTAGIGKTTLLDHLVQRSAGCRVIRIVGCRPEVELPYAGLDQLAGRSWERSTRFRHHSGTRWPQPSDSRSGHPRAGSSSPWPR